MRIKDSVKVGNYHCRLSILPNSTFLFNLFIYRIMCKVRRVYFLVFSVFCFIFDVFLLLNVVLLFAFIYSFIFNF
jgi:hypothetical protein